ncbi:hypothetical protein FZC33_22475 [Labrys sp. KNU-23]|uniref:hypothetical protein n=1 Tax=Labrys sp. KNU-23 TaxID=2789216 RepID=UPI0011EFBEC5|nr:hypothetical protein [Labrys sp. KNU-23]QEN88899.1 hypothetical protein FZC33_22475 [Labrys sp. KNU-23]
MSGKTSHHPPISFANITDISSQHLDLLRSSSQRNDDSPEAIAAFRDRIADFRTGVAAAGARLEKEGDRETAQGIIDYWSTQLLAWSTNGARPDLDLPLASYLDLPGAALPAGATAARRPTGEAVAQDGRAQVRIGSLAYQWRRSNRAPGYLLTGNALVEAAGYRGKDPEIEAFVSASEAAERRTRHIRAGFIVTLVLSIAFAVLALISFFRENEARKEADQLSADNDKRAQRFLVADVRLQTERFQHAAELKELNDQLLAMKSALEEAQAKLKVALAQTPSPTLNPTQHMYLRDSNAVLTQAIDQSRAHKPSLPPLTAGEQLLANVNLIDGPDGDVRRATTENLVRAVRDGTVSPDDQRMLVGALVNMLARPAVQSLTLTGRYNVLYILSIITSAQWTLPAWSALRDRARIVTADLVGPNAQNDLPMGADSQKFYQQLVQRLQ